MNEVKKKVFTIGHSNLLLDKFIALIKMHNVDAVVDIRSVPLSRYCPQYNKENLRNELIKRSISYIFMGDLLGGRIADPSCYKSRSIPARKVNIAELIDYDELLKRNWFQEGIRKLIDLARSNKVVIMCSEEEPARCHRNLLVGRRLFEQGYVVEHIRADGKVEAAEALPQIKMFSKDTTAGPRTFN